jgi:hypothetical protein
MTAALCGGEVAAARRALDAEFENEKNLRARHKVELRDAELAVQAAAARYHAAISGFPTSDYDAVTAILDVWNAAGRLVGDDARAINDAVGDLSTTGGVRFALERVTTKTYEGHSHQYVGWMRNGYAPRHGHVVFEIGLRDDAGGIPPELVDPCIRYLEAIRLGIIVPPTHSYRERAR